MRKMFICSLMIFLAALAMAEQQVEIKEMKGFTYAAMRFSGSYDQMEANIGLFMQEFFKQGLTPTGPVVGVYFNHPRGVDEKDLKWAIGFQVAEDTAVKDPLKKETFKTQKVLYYLHVGPYENLDKAYMKLETFAAEKGLETVWPTFDIYLNNPMQVKPGELKTEVIVTFKEK